MPGEMRENKEPEGPRLYALHLGPLVLFFCVFCVLLGPALFSSEVLLPGEMLVNWAPWFEGQHVEVHNPMLSDVLQQFYPYYAFLQGEIAEGRFPLWNPYVLNGSSFIGTSVSAVLSPLNLVLLVFSQPDSYEIGALIKLLLAAGGIYLYCRRIGFSLEAGLTAGLAYAFAGYNIFLLTFNNTSISALFGFGLLTLEDYLASGRRKSLALFAVIIGCAFLGGHVESAVLHTLAYLLYAAVRSWRSLLEIAAATLTGFGLSAVVTIPFTEFMLHSSTFAQRSSFDRNPYFVSAESWPALMNPFFHGSPIGWQGPMPIQVLEGFVYLGVIPLLFVVVSLVGGSRCVQKWSLVSVFAWSVIVLFGIWPLFDLFTSIPVLRQGSHFHIAQVFQATGSILAGAGVMTADRRRSKPVALLVSLGLIGAAFVFTVAWKLSLPVHVAKGGFPFLGEYVALPMHCVLGLISLTLVAVFRKSRFSPWLVVSLVVANGLMFGLFFHSTVDATSTVSRVPPVVEFLQGRPHDRVVGTETGTLLPNWGMTWRVRDVRGYESLTAPRVPVLYEYLTGEKFDANQWLKDLDPERLRLLSRMGCRWLLSPGRLTLGGLTPRMAGDSFLYEIEGPGRVFLTRDAQAAGTPDQALGFVLRETDPLAVIIEMDPDSSRQLPVGEWDGQVEWVRDLPDTVELRVDQSAESWLVLKDTFFPGWTCLIDDEPAEIFQADYLFRAVRVPGGSHSVVFEYKPISFQIGVVISLVAIVVVTCLAAYRGGRPDC